MGQFGGLVGRVDAGDSTVIENSFATGDITGDLNARIFGSSDGVGGLIGYVSLLAESRRFSLRNSYATGNVSSVAAGNLGGLIGYLQSSVTSKADISRVYATGNVEGKTYTSGGAGGLIGFATSSSVGITISEAHATGNVLNTATSSSYTGGLIGALTGGSSGTGGTLTDSYATGNVTSRSTAGGLVGNSWADISRSYATGNVEARGMGSYVGGLVGSQNYGSISDSYATGIATGVPGALGLLRVGGLVGESFSGEITNSYWNAGNDVGYTFDHPDPSYSPIVTSSGGLDAGLLNDAEITNAIMSGKDPVTTVIIPRAAAAAAARTAQVVGAVEPTVRDVAENAPVLSTVSETGSEMQTVDGLPGGGLSDGARISADAGWGENGETLTLSALGLRGYSATVRALTTDDGDVYELEDDQE
jgi:hypothetical protein